jgi:hypothetical protein
MAKGSGSNAALVPIETWAYGSPLLKHRGITADIGLLADALVYYDKVYINVTTPGELVELIRWLDQSKQVHRFEELLRTGEVCFHHYGFMSAPIYDKRTNQYSLWNMQEPESTIPRFERLVLSHRSVREQFGHTRHAARFHRLALTGLIEAKADDFGPAVEDAKADCVVTQTAQVTMQSLIDVVYPLLGIDAPLDITAQVVMGTEQNNITYNINLDWLQGSLGTSINFHRGTPLAGLMVANRLLVSSHLVNCHLVLPNPLAALTSYKLASSLIHADRVRDIMGELVVEVAFPDIRDLVGKGALDAKTVFEIRDKGRGFRQWLHSEADMTRNAVIAYHQEFSGAAGLSKREHRLLHLFGAIGGSAGGIAIGQAIGTHFGDRALGGEVGGVAGAAGQFLVRMAADLNCGWKPVVFGNWVRNVVEQKRQNGDGN